MGRRGAAPMPTQLRLLKGDRHKERINENEPVPMPGRLEPPDDLHPDVAKVWRKLVIEIEHMGISHASDREQWRIYCEAVVAYRKVSAVVLATPPLLKGRDGGMVKNPAYSQMDKAASMVLRYAREFGLTPSARTMIETTRETIEDGNPFSGTG